MSENLIEIVVELGDECQVFVSKAGNAGVRQRVWVGGLAGIPAGRTVPHDLIIMGGREVAIPAGSYQVPAVELLSYDRGEVRIDWFSLAERIAQFKVSGGGGASRSSTAGQADAKPAK